MDEHEATVLDRAMFDDFAGLYDAAELREVIAEWHVDSIRAVAAVDEARPGGDRARIGEIAHRAAGGGLAIGATALARACERLRAAAESGEDVSDAQVAAVREAVALTHAALLAAASDRS